MNFFDLFEKTFEHRQWRTLWFNFMNAFYFLNVWSIGLWGKCMEYKPMGLQPRFVRELKSRTMGKRKLCLKAFKLIFF